VNQENQTAFEPNNQILAAAANSGNTLARQFCGHLCRIDRTREPGVEDLDLLEAPTDKLRLETGPHRLDFGQLGHSRQRSAAPRADLTAADPVFSALSR
jgi:hypothetical protein